MQGSAAAKRDALKYRGQNGQHHPGYIHSCLCAAPNWGVASLRRVLCGWPALVGWRFSCVCAFDGFLLWVRIASACPTIASLCNKGFPLSRLFATRQFVYTPTEMVTKLLPRHHPVHSASFHALDDVLSSDGMSDATDIKQLCTVRAHKATHQILPNSTPREFRPGGTRFEA